MLASVVFLAGDNELVTDASLRRAALIGVVAAGAASLAGFALRKRGAAAGLFVLVVTLGGNFNDVENIELADELVTAGTIEPGDDLLANKRLCSATEDKVEVAVRVVGDEVPGLFGDLDFSAGLSCSILDRVHLLDFVSVEDVGLGVGVVSPTVRQTVAVAVVLDDTLGGFLSADGVRAVLVSAGHYFLPKVKAFLRLMKL